MSLGSEVVQGLELWVWERFFLWLVPVSGLRVEGFGVARRAQRIRRRAWTGSPRDPKTLSPTIEVGIVTILFP